MKQFYKLEEFCKKNNLKFDEIRSQQFDKFCNLLIERNKVMNLTAVTDPDEIDVKHFVDSVEAAPIILNYCEKIARTSGQVSEIKESESNKAEATISCSYKSENENENVDDIPEKTKNDYGKNPIKIIDMGTGAGFPGIPLAIMLPNIEFTLADALNKRVNFLNEVINAGNIENANALQGRAEEIGQSSMRETFDFCVSRAVASLPVLLEYCLPMVKIGGYAILYKSGDYEEELGASRTALDVLGGEIEEIREFKLPNSDISRSLIVIYKGKTTQIKYPRRPGKPSKSPITNK